ncbi:hypothetical protein BH18ACI4_BH18ACI4_01520 [soil metagenome]
MKLFSRLAIQTIVSVIFACCLPALSYAFSSDIHFDSGKSALKIPFELHNNQIYLQIPINGSKRLWIVLDTGARTIISRSAAQKLGLKLQEQGQMQSTGESSVFKVASTKNVSFKLPGVTFTTQNVGVVAFEDLEKCLGHTADGILGLEFFGSSVVEVDYKRRHINIYDAKSYRYSGKGEAFSLEPLSNGLVTVRAEIAPANRASITGKFIVDTGFTLSLLLNSPFVERNKLLADVQGQKFTVCGFGEAKAIKDKVAALQLGSSKFDNLNTIFSQAKSGLQAADDVDGLIGGELLSQFKVIFDFSRRRIILESYSHS